jgi:acyl-CoA dehydrogenase family member 9
VFARTPTTDGSTKLTAFIVEKAFGNILPGPPEKKLGIRGSNTCVVTFDGCMVPVENVLGKVNGGLKVALSILSAGRYGMGAATGGGIRKLVAMAAEYANSRIQFGHPISSYGLIQEKFARMTLDSYTVESMAYMTTGLIDTRGAGSALPPEQQMDMSIEAAACKIYGSEAMYSAVNDCIQVRASVCCSCTCVCCTCVCVCVCGGGGGLCSLPFVPSAGSMRAAL